MSQNKKNYTVAGIIGIAVFVFGWIAWIVSEYRPTASGQRAWEVIAFLCFAAFVGLIIMAFVKDNRRGV